MSFDDKEFDLETFIPLNGKVLMQLHAAKTKLVAVEKHMVEPVADIWVVGPGYPTSDGGRMKMQVQKGDVVLLGNVTGRNIKIKGLGDCFVVDENCIEAIIGKHEAKIIDSVIEKIEAKLP